MREIKYRAYYKPLEKMYYTVWRKPIVDKLVAVGYQWFGLANGCEEIALEENDTVIMQYTGLKDKNGQEIYEGDIVKGEIIFQGRPMDVEGRVSYVHCRFVIGEYNCELYQFSNNFDGRGTWIEVIGNKYENPELLEGESNE